jgi:hypothetical protein
MFLTAVTPCSQIRYYRRFGRTFSFSFQGRMTVVAAAFSKIADKKAAIPLQA